MINEKNKENGKGKLRKYLNYRGTKGNEGLGKCKVMSVRGMQGKYLLYTCVFHYIKLYFIFACLIRIMKKHYLILLADAGVMTKIHRD